MPKQSKSGKKEKNAGAAKDTKKNAKKGSGGGNRKASKAKGVLCPVACLEELCRKPQDLAKYYSVLFKSGNLRHLELLDAFVAKYDKQCWQRGDTTASDFFGLDPLVPLGL